MTTDNLYLQLEKITTDFKKYDSTSIREEMQLFFDRVNNNYSTTDCPEIYNELTKNGHSILKKLYNCCDISLSERCRCNITSYIENLCFCFDLLCGDWNKRVFFNFDNPENEFTCNPKKLSWAFLNLLSNAIIYSDGRYISVTQKSEDDRIILYIENEGKFNYNRFLSFPQKNDGGLYCANKIISAHGGSLIMTSYEGKTTLAVSLPKVINKNAPVFETPGIDELLYDRLSIVYTALCEI